MILFVLRLVFALAAASMLEASTVTFTNFRTVNVPTLYCTVCVAMNSAGDLAGLDDLNHGFELLANGTTVKIDYPGSPFYQRVFGLNDLDVAVGYYADFSGNVNGFVYDHGTYTPSGLSRSNITQGINNNGDVTGYYDDDINPPTAFLIRGGSVITSGFPDGGDRGTYAQSINDFGYVTGYYYGPGNTGGAHGFVRSPDGNSVSFDFDPSASFTGPTFINNAGIIVGDYGIAGSVGSSAFVRVDGANYSFLPSGAVNSFALSITNNNELFGVSEAIVSGSDRLSYFVVDVNVNSVPEPATSTVMIVALISAFGLRLCVRLYLLSARAAVPPGNRIGQSQVAVQTGYSEGLEAASNAKQQASLAARSLTA